VKILIAEDDPVSRRVLEVNLRRWGYEIVATVNGQEAYLALQAENAPRLAILDWMMPGLSGVEVCRQLRQTAHTKNIYIILLTGMNGKENIVAGLEAGADDYLSKPFDSHELRVRVQAGARIAELQNNLAQRVLELEAAIIERKKVEEQLRDLTLTDELTSLSNHRGFFTLAARHMKFARRSAEPSLLIYADMDGLKQINDTHGHSEGSRAISQMADVLRRTFRETDIVGRIGGDEFAVLCPNFSPCDTEVITARLERNLHSCNTESGCGYSLSLSVGVVCVPHDTEATIQELIDQADAAMYQHKRSKQGLIACPEALQVLAQ